MYQRPEYVPIKEQQQPQTKKLFNNNRLNAGVIITLSGVGFVGLVLLYGYGPAAFVVVFAWPLLIVGIEVLLHSFVRGERFILLVSGVIIFALGLVTLNVYNSSSSLPLSMIYSVFLVVGPLLVLEGLFKVVSHYFKQRGSK